MILKYSTILFCSVVDSSVVHMAPRVEYLESLEHARLVGVLLQDSREALSRGELACTLRVDKLTHGCR